MSKKWKFLIGTRAIADALGVSTSTLYIWREHGFPIVRLPDSHQRWAISTTLIDEWLRDLRQAQRANSMKDT